MKHQFLVLLKQVWTGFTEKMFEKSEKILRLTPVRLKKLTRWTFTQTNSIKFVFYTFQWNILKQLIFRKILNGSLCQRTYGTNCGVFLVVSLYDLLQFFLLIFRIHMSTFVERKKKCKRGKEKVVQKWKVRSNWDSNSPTVINLKMTYI